LHKGTNLGKKQGRGYVVVCIGCIREQIWGKNKGEDTLLVVCMVADCRELITAWSPEIISE
jgi:hypothetical protein